jgi:hypothetical protein
MRGAGFRNNRGGDNVGEISAVGSNVARSVRPRSTASTPRSSRIGVARNDAGRNSISRNNTGGNNIGRAAGRRGAGVRGPRSRDGR